MFRDLFHAYLCSHGFHDWVLHPTADRRNAVRTCARCPVQQLQLGDGPHWMDLPEVAPTPHN